MAGTDATGTDANLPVGITGLNSSGVPTNPVNADSHGNLNAIDYATAATGSAVPSDASYIAGKNPSGNLQGLLTDSSGNLQIAGQGTAGSPVGGVVSVQGVLGGTALPVSQSGTWIVQQGTPPWTIQGDSASGSAAAGNPVQISGVFNTTQPTVTTGQTVAAQMTSRGAQIVATGVDALNVDNITGTVSLPTGASTSANQSTEITSLQLIDNPIGPVAPGTAGTGSELIGIIYNTTLPTFTNGEQGAAQGDVNGRQLVVATGNVASLATDSGDPVKIGSVYNSALPAPTTGERVDSQANQFGEHAVQFRNKYKYITASGTTVVKSGSGRLHGISFAQNSGITVTLYDNTAASGTIIATFESQNMTFIGPLGCEFATGLTITQSGANDITVYYQ